MPSTRVGPVELKDPPFAGMPLVVGNDRVTSKSHMIFPAGMSKARRLPSIDPENTAPLIALGDASWAELQPGFGKHAVDSLVRYLCGCGRPKVCSLPRVTPCKGSSRSHTAFELFQVSDGPGWANSERYDITAKKESDQLLAKPDDDRYRTRALLESRFHLIVHRESKALPIYGLVDTMTNTRATLITSTIIGIVATSGESTAGTVAGPLFGSR